MKKTHQFSFLNFKQISQKIQQKNIKQLQLL